MHYDEENFVGLLETYCYTKAAGWERAAVQARREIGRRQNRRRVFVPQSMMASGILSATRAVPRIPAQDAIPEARPTTQASPLTTPEVPTDVGILLARQAALRNEEESCPISYPCAGASVGVVMFGEAVGVVTVGTAVGVGEVGASASAGRTGVFYWGPAWAFAWDPWWYGSYGYGPWPAYSYYYYPDYSYDWSDNPPPYRPDSSPNSSYDRDPSANYLSPSNSDYGSNRSSNSDDNHFNLNPDRAQATTARSRTARPRSPKLRRTVRLQRLSRLVPQGSRFSSPGRRCAQG